MLMADWGIKGQLAQTMIEKWLTTDVLSVEVVDPKTKVKGLKVIGLIE
jgi:hypothetical protein